MGIGQMIFVIVLVAVVLFAAIFINFIAPRMSDKSKDKQGNEKNKQ
jgi:hypothetical protein